MAMLQVFIAYFPQCHMSILRKGLCRMSLCFYTPCRMSLSHMSHVEFRRKKKACVALSILGVKGPCTYSETGAGTSGGPARCTPGIDPYHWARHRGTPWGNVWSQTLREVVGRLDSYCTLKLGANFVNNYMPFP